MLTAEQALAQSKKQLAKLQDQTMTKVSVAIDRAAMDGLIFTQVDVPSQAGGFVVEKLNAASFKVRPTSNGDGTDSLHISWG